MDDKFENTLQVLRVKIQKLNSILETLRTMLDTQIVQNVLKEQKFNSVT